MILTIEIDNFRMTRCNRVALGPFQVLIGPNGSGKTTFLDVLCLVSDILRKGVPAAVAERTPSFYDLCFDPNRPISMGVLLSLAPDDLDEEGAEAVRMRYELSIGMRDDTGALGVRQENLFILPASESGLEKPAGSLSGEPFSIVRSAGPKGWRRVVAKTEGGQDYFRDEKTAWNNQFKFGPEKSALGAIPEDPDRFPKSLAVRDLLRDGIRRLALEPRRLQSSAPPGGVPELGVDGSNLPYVVKELKLRDPVLFREWTRQLAGTIKGLTEVDVWERDEDRHLVLRARFDGAHSLPVPSWMLSDGTLRLMALTLLSYAARGNREQVLLVEEPENGLHPQAVQTLFEAISSPHTRQQWLCASHSPVFLANVELDQTLVFRREIRGWSIVRRGREIPELSNWSGKVQLADWLALGVLS